MKNYREVTSQGPPFTPSERLGLLRRWTLASTVGILLGVGAGAAIAALVSTAFGQPDTFAGKFGLTVVLLMGGAFHGAITGICQGRVVHNFERRITVGEWSLLTVVGTMAAWLLGTIPFVFFEQPLAAVGELTPGQLAGLAALAAIAFGGLVGFAQYRALRPHLKRADRWIAGNMLGWAIGAGVIYAGATATTTTWGLGALTGTAVLAILLAGILIGFVTGLFLTSFRYSP